MPSNITLNPHLQYAEIGLNQQMLPVFLGLLLAATIAWFYLSNRLYSTLQQIHPMTYDKLGKPRLFMKRSLATNFRVIQFLLQKEYEMTDDQIVIRLCQGMRSILFIYLVCLAGSLLLLASKLL